jgi:lipopolysaccharide export system permease protein
MGLKKIDIYVITHFIKNLLFALLCFVLIFILVDLFENLDKFIDNNIGLGLVLIYYLYFIPEIIKLITPISMLLATLFTAGRMTNFNELTAVKNAGVSLFRFMLPFLYVGIIITGFSIYFNNWLVPEANKNKFSIERNYLGKHKNVTGLNRLYFQDSQNQVILIEQFNENELTANKVSIFLFDSANPTILKRRVDAEKMKWESVEQKPPEWVLYNAVDRELETSNSSIKNYEHIQADALTGINKLNLDPKAIIKKQLKPDEMNYSEISDFIDSQVKSGQNVDRIQVDFYSKISFPFSSLIVIIFGISISTGSRSRKGLAMQFGISILVSFVYLGFVKISQTFGYNGDLNPMLTAWLANIAFAGFGGVNLFLRNY